MISQLSGALIRAFFVSVVVLLPAVLLPQENPQIMDAVVLLALFAGLFVVVEYASIYPGLVEFRDAPPFNRVRFGILAVTVLFLTLVMRGQTDPTTLSRLLEAIGLLLGRSVDLPGSPIRLILWLLPEGTTLGEAHLVRVSAGLSYLVALVGLTVFAIMIRVQRWPTPSGAFNVWINLPTFDPTAGADVVRRLNRDGLINILLGVALPYITPPLVLHVGSSYDLSLFSSELVLIWVMATWAFLPASLFLRGIAMRRLALMITAKRRRFDDAMTDPSFLPA